MIDKFSQDGCGNILKYCHDARAYIFTAKAVVES